MLNNKTIIKKIDALIPRHYPSDCISVASLSAYESERKTVDAIFLGKKWNEIDIERVSRTENSIFLTPDAIVYYWKTLLKTLYFFPESIFTSYFIGVMCENWDNHNSDHYIVRKELNDSEKYAFYLILYELSKINIDQFARDEIKKFLLKNSLMPD